MRPSILEWSSASSVERNRVLSRAGTVAALVGTDELAADIKTLVADVAARGDAALVDALRKFDGVEVEPSDLAVAAAEFDEAEAAISPELSRAIDVSIRRSRAFNTEILRRASWTALTDGGGVIGEIARPIESVGLFVPSGKGSFPSVLVQIGTPATVAGVSDIVLVVPPLPGREGKIDPATLVVAHRLGIERVFRLNGPSGIAALAHGTQSVPRVRKIVGPGSIPVSLAQQLVQAEGCSVVNGLGPSDSLILADETADPVLLAADVINEAEHGPDSSAVLVSPSRSLLERVAAEIEVQLADLPEPRRGYADRSITRNGGLILVADIRAGMSVANQYAPEHIQIATADPDELLPHLRFAGTALLGQWTTFASSNFVIGTPATLPTSGYATFVSGVTAHTYLNKISLASIGEEEFWELSDSVVAFARHEGFPAHEASVTRRAATHSTDVRRAP